MNKKRRIISFTIMAALAVVIAVLIYRGFGTGYVRTVSGVSVPLRPDSVEHYSCDFGQFSVYRLSDDSVQKLIADNTWIKAPPDYKYENDCLTFPSLNDAEPLPVADELIWMEGARRREVWRMYLHMPSRRLFVAIGYPDMAGDIPEGALDRHKEEG